MSRRLIGQLVYTINNQSKLIDSWRCTDVFKGINNEIIYELREGKKVILLPKRCVYPTYKKAYEAINK
jgi:ribose 1,5-bisphosphokinase PhnN